MELPWDIFHGIPCGILYGITMEHDRFPWSSQMFLLTWNYPGKRFLWKLNGVFHHMKSRRVTMVTFSMAIPLGRKRMKTPWRTVMFHGNSLEYST